jgi:endonuclease/exonuclease/phosphatase family metal-dependent hydrolase
MEEVRFLDHELGRLLVDLPQKDIPIVLCGDFNNTPDSPVHRYMTDCFLGAKSPRGDDSRVSECCGDQVCTA